MATIGKMVVSLTARTSKFTKGMSSAGGTVKSFVSGVGTAVKRVAALGAVMAGVAAVGVVKLIQAASEFEETSGKFVAVFKELAPEAEAFTAALAQELGRSRVELTGFMATLQDTFVPLGFAREEGLEMSKVLTRLTVDLASFNNKAQPDVLADLQSAMVGNHETMRKYGVIITQASLNQELLNQGIAGGTKVATEQEKAMARMGLIMASTTDAQGDALRTSGSFANQMRSLMAAVEEVNISMGSALLPTATKLIVSLKSLAGWVRAQSPAIAAWIKDLIEGGKVIGVWLVDQLTKAVETGIWVFTFWEQAIGNWKTTVDAGVSFVLLQFVRFGSQLEHLFTVVIPANLQTLVNMAEASLITWADLNKTFFTNMLDNADSFFTVLWAKLRGDEATFEWKGLLDGFEVTKGKIETAADRIPGTLEKALEKDMMAAGGDLGAMVAEAAGKRIEKFRAFVGDIPGLGGAPLPDAVSDAFDKGGQAAGENIKKAVESVTTPGALERGTVEAFSATLSATNRRLAESGAETVSQLKENNNLLRASNKHLADIASDSVVVAIP